MQKSSPMSSISQDGRYKNFSCRQRLVINPNYPPENDTKPKLTTLSSPHQVQHNNNNNTTNNTNSTSNSHAHNSTNDSQEEAILPWHHPLQYRYNLWFSKRNPGKLTSTQSYDQTLKLLASFATVEDFWSIYSYLIRPSDLVGHFDFHLFKAGIKPMWEDEANKRGGKWVIRLKKGISSRCWENLVLAILGEQFMLNDEICGAVISTRFAEDIISIWNRNSHNLQITSHIRDTLRRILNLPANTIMQYKPHNESLKDHSNFKTSSSSDQGPAGPSGMRPSFGH